MTLTVDRPIDPRGVRLVATSGYPLWEPVDAMVQRNRRITEAYAALSRRLAELIAGDGVLEANWCTFAQWSSKTIGTWIESIDHLETGAVDLTSSWRCPESIRGFDRLLPPRGRNGANRLGRWMRGSPARSCTLRFRVLAAGNRAVFLDVGLSIATFLEHFPTRRAALGSEGDARWAACWQAVQAELDALAALDPSWMLTPNPPPDDLRRGLHSYYVALRTDDPALRAQHVLAANLLVAAYEQRRVDGYVRIALALLAKRALRRSTAAGAGMVRVPTWRPNRIVARSMTRRIGVHLGDELVWLHRAFRPTADRADRAQRAERGPQIDAGAGTTLPLLRSLVARYRLAGGRRLDRGASNWTSFEQRMRIIGNLFLLRRRQASLFDDPLGRADGRASALSA